VLKGSSDRWIDRRQTATHDRGMTPSPSSRRQFLGQAATLGVGAVVLPRHLVAGAIGRRPSRTLNIACIGIGGMGMSNMAQMLSENIVAVCDVDFAYVERALEGRLRPRDGQVSEEALRLKDVYTAAVPAPHRDVARGELGRRVQGRGGGQLPLLVRRAAQ
jgi:hypothetical protein